MLEKVNQKGNFKNRGGLNMLKVKPLEYRDYDLIKAAEKVIKKNYKSGRHYIGSAVRTASGCNPSYSWHNH